MRLFALVIFLSAFLLFQVQPMIAKVILPWFGSSAGVWTACLMFFQSALLLGYFYAHGIVRTLSWKRQAIAHIVLLVASLLALPIMPGEFWKPTSAGNPTGLIVLMLLACVGGPYLMLASTGPLLQRWFGELQPGKSPYRLFALSNAGSLAGLLTYPFVFERLMTLHTQTTYWSIAYGVFVLACGTVAYLLWRHSGAQQDKLDSQIVESAGLTAEEAGHQSYAPVNGRQILLWLGLSACGSIMLLSTTNLMCQDIAAVPFLWVVPLSIYLLTFIVAFDSPRWYYRPIFLPAAMGGAALLLWGSIDPDGAARAIRDTGIIDRPVWALVLIFSAGLFAMCMGCHGELARAKPHPSRLTLYYLCVSGGGALGGLLVGIVAPSLFLGYWEFAIGIVLSLILIGIAAASKPGERNGLVQFFADVQAREFRQAFLKSPHGYWIMGVLLMFGAAPFSDPIVRNVFREGPDHLYGEDEDFNLVEVRRNFFGVWRTTDDFYHPRELPKPVRKRTLVHGRITHGYQFSGELRRAITSYYGERSGLGLAMTRHPQRNPNNDDYSSGSPMRIGVIGLGSGSVAAYAQDGDYLRFYEINPLMVETAEEAFSYLSDARDAGADVDVFVGDARLLLERQFAESEQQKFDVLAVDAFSGDAIPIHLLTKECYDIYWDHLNADGVLAVHISNRYLKLERVVRGLAATDGRTAMRVYYDDDDAIGNESLRLTSCEWMLVTNNQEFIQRYREFMQLPPDAPLDSASQADNVLWTDDFSSLLSVLYDPTSRRSASVEPSEDQGGEENSVEKSEEDAVNNQ